MAPTKVLNCSHGQALSFEYSQKVQLAEVPALREITSSGSLKKSSFFKKNFVLYLTIILLLSAAEKILLCIRYCRWECTAAAQLQQGTSPLEFATCASPFAQGDPRRRRCSISARFGRGRTTSRPGRQGPRCDGPCALHRHMVAPTSSPTLLFLSCFR